MITKDYDCGAVTELTIQDCKFVINHDLEVIHIEIKTDVLTMIVSRQFAECVLHIAECYTEYRVTSFTCVK